MGCGCVQGWLEREKRGQQRWEQKESYHPLTAVLSSLSSQSISPHPRAPCQGLVFLYPTCSDKEQAGLFTQHG